MTANTWYTISFLDGVVVYFLPNGEIQKNSKRVGLLVTVDTTRPRAKPRSKKSAVHPVEFSGWKVAQSVPAAVALLGIPNGTN